jgi:glycosyltransferase involved in cell wall biosynthesis
VDLLFCHGYKAGLLGRIAARRQRLPVVGVSRGWTYENLKVNVYEFLDRLNLRLMDHVVCVSQAQARKVMRCGVPSRLVSVIPDSVDVKRFGRAAIGARTRVLQFFETPPRWIVGAIGRLSPEKGFDDFVRAARAISAEIENVGFLIIGEGKTRSALERLIAELGMRGRVVLTGFRNDIDELLPALDVMVQSSHTEGMPNVVLEACAACVPVVATRVGGTSEIILDGQTGRLVPPGEPEMVAAAVRDALHDYGLHVGLAIEGRSRVESSFTFDAQAEAYSALVEALAHGSRSHEPDLPAVANSHTGGVIAHGPVR